MIKRLRRFLTSRETAVTLLLLMFLSLLAANIVPQRGAALSVGGKTEVLPESRNPVVRALGLDHVFGTPWFAALSGIFLLTLSISTWDQFQATRRKITAVPSRLPEAGLPLDDAALAALLGRARSMGYRLVGDSEGCERHLRWRSGFWGGFLLHFGMTVTVFFGVVYALTEHRVIVRLVEGEKIRLADAVIGVRKGLLAGNLRLPESALLEKLRPDYWPGDALKELASDIELTDPSGGRSRITTAVSDKAVYNGMLLYQQTAHGTVFLLEFREEGGEPFPVILPLDMPAARDKAAYGETPIEGGRFTLKAKYFASAGRDSMEVRNPVLNLRLMEGETIRGESELVTNREDSLGPYSVRLRKHRLWTDLLFEGSRGMAGIFLGFAILFSGGMAAYILVPRELLVCRQGGEVRVLWRAGKFAALYESERELIFSAAGSGPQNASK